MKRLIIFTIFVGLLSSCEIDITDKFIADSSPKLVLVGEFVAGHSPRISLTHAISMLEKDTIIGIESATLSVENGSERFEFSSMGMGYYSNEDFVVEAGESYTVNCTCDGFDAVSVEVDIPEEPDLEISYTVDDAYVLHFRLSISDKSEILDFYSFRIEGWMRQITNHWSMDSFIGTDTINVFSDYYLHFSDSVPEYKSYNARRRGMRFTDIDENYSGGSNFYFSDKKINGSQYEMDLEIPLRGIYNDTIPEFTVYLGKMNQDYYNFIESYVRYSSRGSEMDFIDTDLPLTQPVSLYSNIEGGFGLLVGRTEYSRVIDMSEYYLDPDFLDYLNPE